MRTQYWVLFALPCIYLSIYSCIVDPSDVNPNPNRAVELLRNELHSSDPV